jgi:hypothetical protein
MVPFVFITSPEKPGIWCLGALLQSSGKRKLDQVNTYFLSKQQD